MKNEPDWIYIDTIFWIQNIQLRYNDESGLCVAVLSHNNIVNDKILGTLQENEQKISPNEIKLFERLKKSTYPPHSCRVPTWFLSSTYCL